MKKAQKVELVKNLAEELKSAKSLVLVNYSGLDVKGQQELKKRLAAADSRMIVVKNTLLKRAGEDAKLDKEILTDTVLSGQTALIIASGDPVAPIQVLGKFAKENEFPKFKVGILDEKFLDSLSLSQISMLPGRDVLLGQLLGSLMTGMYGLVATLQNPMSQLIYTIDPKSKGGEK